ncbi:hypothetical protein ACFQJC_09915 [Haloferax namakaokahaiae]|uniref:Uncharacterized protein n=1 Tax=Haloferax namakaokahaiae TaxID=1748331 RepID=A0ABD5ZF40_9EURY
MVSTGRQLLGRVRRPATGNAAMGVFGLVVAVGALFLTYSLVSSMADAMPLLSTTAIVFLGIGMWLVVWVVLDMAASRFRA